MSLRMRAKSLIAVVALSCALPNLALADGQSGPYLAGRAAMAKNEFQPAARYLTRAMARDPHNVEIMESAALAFIGIGETDKAIAIARRLNGIDETNQLGALLLVAAAVSGENYDDAAALLSDDAIGPLIRDLALAWVAAGKGEMSDALEGFQQVADTEGLKNFGLTHLSAAHSLVGDLEQADAILSGEAQGEVVATKRVSLLHAEVLAQLDQPERALQVLDTYLQFENDPDVLDLREDIQNSQVTAVSVVTSPRDGLAEVFYGVSAALAGEADDVFTLAYARIAEYLRPDHTDATLLAAGILESLGQYELATKDYDRIARDDPAYLLAELGRADALSRADKEDTAIEVLQRLSESFPEMPDVFSRLGDQLRRMQRYEDAIQAYDRAITLAGEPEADDWFVYYTRGISHEREDSWELAEADFRTALKLNPDQPQVLNYIGYSFVEMQVNLDEALAMIERAVELRPQDGYITDSLGWVFYRLGRFDEAVQWMEQAAALMPVDPVINDHLGDAFWVVGREREARFQWNRAMSFEPEDEDATRIRRKLEVGLDIVLAEEDAAGLDVANDG